MTAREGNMGSCHPDNTNVDRGEAEVDICFRGVTISHVTLSCSQYLYNINIYCVVITFHSHDDITTKSIDHDIQNNEKQYDRVNNLIYMYI